MGASMLRDSKTVAVVDLARPSQSVPQGFPICSQSVPQRFPVCSQSVPQVFPTAPCFNPIFFAAQSPPLLTFIRGPKGRTR
jgi:hypothetical protein